MVYYSIYCFFRGLQRLHSFFWISIGAQNRTLQELALRILNENLPAEDALPTLLSRSAARPTAIGDKKDGE